VAMHGAKQCCSSSMLGCKVRSTYILQMVRVSRLDNGTHGPAQGSVYTRFTVGNRVNALKKLEEASASARQAGGPEFGAGPAHQPQRLRASADTLPRGHHLFLHSQSPPPGEPRHPRSHDDSSLKLPVGSTSAPLHLSSLRRKSATCLRPQHCVPMHTQTLALHPQALLSQPLSVGVYM
jgi:hypothetical protein